MLLTGRGANKNHYQDIFRELYRRLDVLSYEPIRLAQYQALLVFLDDWMRQLKSRRGMHNTCPFEQASEIVSAVQSIAMALSQRDPTKNHFQGIHGELHRRFGTTSYKLIRQEQYGAVLTG